MSNMDYLDMAEHHIESLKKLDKQFHLLPYPKRRTITHPEFYEEGVFQGKREAVYDILKNPKVVTRTTIDWLRFDERTKDLYTVTKCQWNELSISPLRYKALNGKIFEIADTSTQLIQNTNIIKGCPCQFIKSPYPAIYLHKGHTHYPILLHKDSSQEAYFEGAYIFEFPCRIEDYQGYGLKAELTSELASIKRIIEIYLVASPLQKKEITDHVMHYFNLVIEDEDEDVTQLIERSLPVWREVTQDNEAQIECLEYIIKALLYINSDNVRRELKNSELDVVQRLARVKGGKRKKLERSLTYQYDRILINPPHDPTYEYELKAAKGERSPHWRRGHYRLLQRHEAKNGASKRLIWVRPTLVRADKAALGSVRDKDYLVK